MAELINAFLLNINIFTYREKMQILIKKNTNKNSIVRYMALQEPSRCWDVKAMLNQ